MWDKKAQELTPTAELPSCETCKLYVNEEFAQKIPTSSKSETWFFCPAHTVEYERVDLGYEYSLYSSFRRPERDRFFKEYEVDKKGVPISDVKGFTRNTKKVTN